MNHVWWRTHLRRLPELGFLERFGDFNEVDEFMPFLTEALELPRGGRVLDVGCGRGSFSIRLAQWGYSVTGVDQSEPMLAVARAAAERRGAQVEFRQEDPRELPDRSAFDGAVIADFGTYSDVDNAAILRTVATALRPGGKLVFGTFNPYHWAREPRTVHRASEGVDVIRAFSFDFGAGTVVSKVRCILPGGERRDLPTARYRAYTLPELKMLVSGVGLADLKTYGQDEAGLPRTDRPLDNLRTPIFHGVALRPVTGEAGEGS